MMDKDGPQPTKTSSSSHQTDLSALGNGAVVAGRPGTTAVNGLGPPPSLQSGGGDPLASGSSKGMGPSCTKLCGYLDKLGGPLKSWKSRWFSYDEKQCQLMYYRTAQDVNPLGKVELTSASFGYLPQAEEGAFQIQTPERTFILKAVSRDAMMYWLQHLQLKRWQHRDGPEHAYTCAGREQASSGAPDAFLPTVKTPPGLVGQEAACLPAPRQVLSNVSFKHPLTELQNSMHSFLRSRAPQDVNRSVFYWEVPSPQLDPAGPAPDSQSGFGSTSTNEPLADISEEVPSAARTSPCTPGTSTKNESATSLPADLRDVAGDDEVPSNKDPVEQGLQGVTEVPSADGRESSTGLPCDLKVGPEGPDDPGDLLQSLHDQLEALREQLRQRDAHVVELEEHVLLMMEKNRAKQEVVLKLSQQVEECMADPQRTVSNSAGAQSFRQLQEEIEHLKDDIEAYKIQNTFLNSEIYQLTRLWQSSSEQEKLLMKKCAFLEAKCCQVESRYLGTLQKLQETKGLSSGQREMVSKLIEEAVQKDVPDQMMTRPTSEYDEYGFKLIQDIEVEDLKLLAKIQALESHSYNVLRQEAGDKLRLSRWAQYLGGRPLGELVASPELKDLLRLGVPEQYRAGVWRWMVWRRTRSVREKWPHRYQELCQKSMTSPHPASRQIQLDLHRTLCSNQFFSSPSNPTVQQLHRVLLAFSWQNPSVGYCQGLNRLAAIALLVLQNEEDAFWCLVAVVETIMPQDYYNKSLTASQADQRVLKDFMMEKMPRLTSHFEQYHVDVSLITFNWFLVVFVESLPSKVLLRVWDAFLYEGTKVIFRYALAIFKYKEEDILKIHDAVELYQYLCFFTKTISDGRKLSTVAFVDMNPFPMKVLQNRRAQHLERLKAELQELEHAQKEFLAESAELKDKELDAAVSEDEEDP